MYRYNDTSAVNPVITQETQTKQRADFDAISYDLDKLYARKWKKKEAESILASLQYVSERIVHYVEATKGEAAADTLLQDADRLKEIMKFCDQHPEFNHETYNVTVVSSSDLKAELLEEDKALREERTIKRRNHGPSE
jgi:hypothetical protein